MPNLFTSEYTSRSSQFSLAVHLFRMNTLFNQNQTNMKKLYLVMGLVCGLLMSTSTFAQKSELPAGVKKNTTVEGITEYELDNGLKVLLFPDQSKPTMTVNITYMVGSRHEAYGETGMAHLLEHLVFKGTPDHPNIPAELTEHGARPNGTTWYDRTNYFETFSASEENLKWALDLESDRMINSFIAKKDLDSEFSVVRNEFESGENNPSGVLMERVLSTAYLWHNYGKSTIGARSDIENVPIGRLQGFYKKYYQPDNAILLVAGKIDERKTINLVAEYFGDIPRPTRKLYPTYTKEPTQDGERNVVLSRVGDVQSVSCMYHTPPGSHKDYAAMAILDEILTNEPAGRLYKAMVEPKLASYVWSFAPALKEGGFIYINADVRKENDLAAAEKAMMSTLDGIGDNPPTEEEVDRAKARILKYWNLAYNNSDRVGTRMSEYIAQGDWRLFFLFRDKIENVSAADVVAAAKKYFKPSNRTTGKFIPTDNVDRTEIPDAPPIASLVEGYKGKAEVSAGEEFDPSPSNIDNRTNKGTLKAGGEYAYLTKENRGDAVVGNIRLRFGTPKSLVGKEVIGQFTARMLNRGTKTMNYQQLQDKLDALEAQVSVYGSSSSASFNINTTHDNLPEVIDLVGEMATSPAFSEDEFNKLVEEQLSSMEESLSDPQAVASNTLGRMTSPYKKDDVRYVMTMEEEIEAIKALKFEDIKKFYDEFYGASEATISIVGDFDEGPISNKIKKYFGDWKNPGKYERITSPYNKVEAGDVNLETPDKANAMFFAALNLPVGDEHPDYAALMIGNYMLGGGFLNSRLATRIRQKEGLSYGVGSWFNGSAQDESGMFGAYAIYAPENRDKVQSAFKDEINKMVKDGFTAEELAAAKSGWLQSQNVTRSQDRSVGGMLGSNLRLDRTMAWKAELEKKIEGLSVEQINAAMARHIDAGKMVYIKAGDFSKAFKTVKP